MLTGDSFVSCFGITPPGDDADRLAAIARTAVRKGYAILLNDPGTKRMRCPLPARVAKAADREAAEAAAERGKPNPSAAKHACGPAHAFCVGSDPKAPDKVHRAITRLSRTYPRLNMGIELGRSRLVAVDVDTPEQDAAFLTAWSEATGADESHRSVTVASPGKRVIDADGTEHWPHYDGGHYVFTLPEGVEMPTHPGKLVDPSGWTVMWAGVQILVPPSRRPEGPYRVVSTPTELPDWLLSRIQDTAAARAARYTERVGRIDRSESDIDQCFVQVPWDTLLADDGWIATGTAAACGCPVYTAPGEHASPKSATAHESGCGYFDDVGSGLLHIWTDNPPEFLAGAPRTLTKLGYVARSQFDGDESAAMAAFGIVPSTPAPEATVIGDTASVAGSDGANEVPLCEQDAVDATVFWDERPVLGAVRDYARARMVGPWALLAAVLGRLCAYVSPQVVTPAIVGGPGSLNTCWVLYGDSGTGKDIALDVAEEFLPETAGVRTVKLGTGQGIDSTYTAPGKRGEKPVQYNDSTLFRVSEVDNLTAHAEMSGSNLLSTLRDVYSGAVLGSIYTDSAKYKPVPAHAYRFVVLMGMQPTKSRVLLGDIKGGTPQRWLWLPTWDSGAEDEEPEITPPIWEMNLRPELVAEGENFPYAVLPERTVLSVPARIRREVRRYHKRRRRRLIPENDLDSHAVLTRLKVAGLLALLDKRESICEQDWALSGTVMVVSNRTRDEVQREQQQGQKQVIRAKAIAENERTQYLEEQAQQRVQQRARDAVLNALDRHSGEWVSGATVRKSLTSSLRPEFPPAITKLIEGGQVEAQEVEYQGRPGGQQYRRVQS